MSFDSREPCGRKPPLPAAVTRMAEAVRVAAELRQMANDLWRVEHRIDVDEDAELLLSAAKLLETVWKSAR